MMMLRTPIASTSARLVRGMSTKALAAVPVPQPTATIKDPSTFLQAISRRRRNLTAIAPLASALGDSYNNIFRTSSLELKKAGVPVKERRFFLWAREKFRQGEDPAKFVKDAKPKKIIRGWGPRVQTAQRIRVRGIRRQGEK